MYNVKIELIVKKDFFMTIEKVSFRDFVRGEVSGEFLILIDKKSKKEKGLFIDKKYSDDFIDFLKIKQKEKIERKKRALLDFVGEFGDGKEYINKSHKEIKAIKYE